MSGTVDRDGGRVAGNTEGWRGLRPDGPELSRPAVEDDDRGCGGSAVTDTGRADGPICRAAGEADLYGSRLGRAGRWKSRGVAGGSNAGAGGLAVLECGLDGQYKA